MSDRATATATDFRERFGAPPTVAATAPGRINLVGGHTDYNEGLVLPAAIDRRTLVAGRPRPDRTVRVHSDDFDATHTVDLDAVEPRGDPGWLDYVAGVVAAVARSAAGRNGGSRADAGRDGGSRTDAGDDGRPDVDGSDSTPTEGRFDPPVRVDDVVGGLDLLVDGGVPMGAGLSSSAALELAVAAVVDAAFDLGLPRRDLALACWRAETGFVGVECGVMDQFAAALGEAGAALFLDCRSLDHEPIPMGADDVRPVVVDTNVSHDLVDSAYNQRVAECREGVAWFDAVLDRPVTALRDVDPADVDRHWDALGRDLSDAVRRRCRHVTTENERVRAAADAMRAGDPAGVGEAMYESHRSLRDDYEVSCAELDLVVSVARGTEGVLGARMTGGGFGGSVVALVRAGAVEGFRERVLSEFPSAVGADPDVYECATADGVTVEDP